MSRLGVLCLDELSPGMQRQLLASLPRSAGTMAGGNRSDIGSHIVSNGILSKDEKLVQVGINAIADAMVLHNRQGIKDDYTFHQHGPLLSTFGYGSIIIHRTTFWCSMFRDTRFSLPKDKLKIMTDFILNGIRWGIRGKQVDYSCMGRGISRPHGSNTAEHILKTLKLLKELATDANTREQLELTHQSIVGAKAQPIIGNRHFYRSDYTCIQEKEYLATIKMCSLRTKGIEGINNENLNGFWLPFGATFVYKTGSEYHGIFPFWDWTRIPGVTAPVYQYKLDKACILLIDEAGDQPEITLADPNQKEARIIVTLKDAKGDRRVTFDLPTGVKAGKSCTAKLDARVDKP